MSTLLEHALAKTKMQRGLGLQHQQLNQNQNQPGIIKSTKTLPPQLCNSASAQLSTQSIKDPPRDSLSSFRIGTISKEEGKVEEEEEGKQGQLCSRSPTSSAHS